MYERYLQAGITPEGTMRMSFREFINEMLTRRVEPKNSVQTLIELA